MELLPGFRVWIDKAVSEGDKCEYTIKEEIDASSVASGSFFSPRSNVCDRLYTKRLEDHDFIYHFEVLDSEGNPATYAGNSSGSGSGGIRIRTATWTQCSGIDVIRYTIAVDPYRVMVPLTLVDISLNNF
jgi:hypothetical protein